MTKKLQLILSTIILSLTLSAQLPSYVPTSSLVTWYSFTGNANDLSGNGNNGTVNGATLTTDRFSNPNSAYGYDGVNDYIISNASPSYISNTISISFWISYVTDFTYFSLMEFGGNTSILWGATCGATTLRASVGPVCSGTGNLLSYTTTTSWHMVTYVIVNTNQLIYYDGTYVGTENNNLISSLSCDMNNLYIGTDWAQVPEYFNGKLDDMGIWNRALTPCEISQLYNSGISPINATSTSSLLCAGQSATLNATGANSYTWNPGALNGSSISVSPTVSTTYTIAGTNTLTGCVNNKVFTQSVSALPQVTATTSSSLICRGETATLTASGANSYTWNPGALSGTNIVVSPSVTTTYTLSGTNTLTGCANNTIVTQNVSPCTSLLNNSLGQNFGLNIYPNPNNGEFTISTATDINLTITNELGQIVKTISLTSKNNHQVSVSTLANGIYFVSGNNGSTSVKEKIIISR